MNLAILPPSSLHIYHVYIRVLHNIAIFDYYCMQQVSQYIFVACHNDWIIRHKRCLVVRALQTGLYVTGVLYNFNNQQFSEWKYICQPDGVILEKLTIQNSTLNVCVEVIMYIFE